MSEEAKEVSILDQFRQQHATYVHQRDQAQVNFQQLVGAIFACEQMIAKLLEAEKNSLDDAIKLQGASENGQVNEQEAG